MSEADGIRAWKKHIPWDASLAAGALAGFLIGGVLFFGVAVGIGGIMLSTFQLFGLPRNPPASTQTSILLGTYLLYMGIVFGVGIALLRFYFISGFLMAFPLFTVFVSLTFINHH